MIAERGQGVGDPRVDAVLLVAGLRVGDREVGVLAEEHRVGAAVLELAAELGRVHAVVGEDVPEADLHFSPLITRRSFGRRSAIARSAPRPVGS